MFDRVSGDETSLDCRDGDHAKEWFRSLRHRHRRRMRIARRGQTLLCMECGFAVPVVWLNLNVVSVMKSNDGGLTMAQSVVQYENETDSVKK